MKSKSLYSCLHRHEWLNFRHIYKRIYRLGNNKVFHIIVPSDEPSLHVPLVLAILRHQPQGSLNDCMLEQWTIDSEPREGLFGVLGGLNLPFSGGLRSLR